MVGIALADRRFFPLVDERSGGAKRVVLEPAHEGQRQVEVRLLMRDDQKELHVGSLFIEAEGEVVVDVLVRDGRLVARARSGDRQQHLNVNLSLIEEEYALPDLDLLSLEEREALEEEMRRQGDLDEDVFSEWEEERPRRSAGWWLLLVAGVLLGLGVALGGAYLVYRFLLQPEPLPRLEGSLGEGLRMAAGWAGLLGVSLRR
ncbi:hypothetical protein [Spirochaeta thermophila]|uniref:Putative membrane protein n=1 Tax=Winmispira thermophila (strain ATCC 49972 / DSM 6192 / RI 19.B1) TaxID=665571 RepID=E0RPE2_WINT6|nr:hypothetical protein [Spirochaeta thermophila]ADN02724.1 putative membrane protein [Spirochaeta thermophila DSM 6192]